MKRISSLLPIYFILVFFILSFSIINVKAVDDIPSPVARSGHNMVYNPTNGEIILFGGMKDNNNVEGELFE